MDSIQALIGDFARNPVWALALGGVISLLIWRQQTILSHSLTEREARRKLYCDFLDNIGKVCLIDYHYEGPGSPNPYETPAYLQLKSLEAQIAITGSNNVINGTRSVVAAIETNIRQDFSATIADGKSMLPYEAIASEQNKLVRLMKEDLKR